MERNALSHLLQVSRSPAIMSMASRRYSKRTSATHQAISATRMEPVSMALGHSAGAAAVMALLLEQGQVLEPPN